MAALGDRAEEPGLLLRVVVILSASSLPAKPPFDSSQPRLAGLPGQTSGRRGRRSPEARWGQEPQTTVSSFLHAASAQPWGCLPGRQGVGVGTPSHLLQDRPLPGIFGQAGWGALCES